MGSGDPGGRARASHGSSHRPARSRSWSTSAAPRCPGLPGKNFVDLGIEADPDDIPAISEAILSLGFGRQQGVAPFPPTRPMFTGTVVHDGRSHRIHLHVMPAGPRGAGRARRVPRGAARGRRAPRRVRRGEAADRRRGARRRGEPAVHGPQGRLRPRRAVPLGHPQAAGRPRPSRCHPAPRSGSWAAASSAGCSRSRRARWATGSSRSTRTRAARRRRSPTRSSSGATTTWTPPAGSATRATS